MLFVFSRPLAFYMQQDLELTQVKRRYFLYFASFLKQIVILTSRRNSCSVFQALVYYTFGALGGNLIAHMILVSSYDLCIVRHVSTISLNIKSYILIRATDTGQVWEFLKVASQH